MGYFQMIALGTEMVSWLHLHHHPAISVTRDSVVVGVRA